MSPAEQKRSARSRWCKVAYAGKTGWVAGRFLAEGGAGGAHNGSAVGAWTLLCARGACWIEQLTMRAPRATLLRIEPMKAQNARVVIERTGLPRQGAMTIELDGAVNSSGPIAPFVDKAGRRIVMPPDDITLGLLRAMASHKSMTVRLDGETAGAEFDVSLTGKALEELARLGGQR